MSYDLDKRVEHEIIELAKKYNIDLVHEPEAIIISEVILTLQYPAAIFSIFLLMLMRKHGHFCVLM